MPHQISLPFPPPRPPDAFAHPLSNSSPSFSFPPCSGPPISSHNCPPAPSIPPASPPPPAFPLPPMTPFSRNSNAESFIRTISPPADSHFAVAVRNLEELFLPQWNSDHQPTSGWLFLYLTPRPLPPLPHRRLLSNRPRQMANPSPPPRLDFHHPWPCHSFWATSPSRATSSPPSRRCSSPALLLLEISSCLLHGASSPKASPSPLPWAGLPSSHSGAWSSFGR